MMLLMTIVVKTMMIIMERRDKNCSADHVGRDDHDDDDDVDVDDDDDVHVDVDHDDDVDVDDDRKAVSIKGTWLTGTIWLRGSAPSPERSDAMQHVERR